MKASAVRVVELSSSVVDAVPAVESSRPASSSTKSRLRRRGTERETDTTGGRRRQLPT
jgi:hypothetical protein